ncbi:hypothetical protein LIER_16604 [Lithospermum erythrorhizon]|uniref:Uncharacterized protein n=1 Tax=Lithospermum erythrorhizon TaxID=34254 RepID=A0AAV3QBR6_LITER
MHGNTCRGHCRKNNAKLCICITPEKDPKWIISLVISGVVKIHTGSSLNFQLEQHSKLDFTLAAHFLEAFLTGLVLLQDDHIHSLYVVIDGLFSQIWLRINRDLRSDQAWVV